MTDARHMDEGELRRHEKTYRGFISLGFWFVVHMAFILAGLFFIAHENVPSGGVLLVLIGIGALIYGGIKTLSSPRELPDPPEMPD